MTFNPSQRLAAVTLASLSLLVAGANPVFGQQADQALRDEIEALKQGQDQIRSELQEIKRLLQTQQRPAPSGPDVEGKVFALGDNAIRGERTAKLTLVEFTDYQ